MDESYLPHMDASYARPWKMLKDYVYTQGGPVNIDGKPHFLTRLFVDGYFTTVILTLEIQPIGVTLHRIVLQWYADNL